MRALSPYICDYVNIRLSTFRVFKLMCVYVVSFVSLIPNRKENEL